MRCSKCALENRDGRKFCAECGVPLNTRCASCGTENEALEKFCGECGVALVGQVQAVSAKAEINPSSPGIRVATEVPAGAPLDGERKTVTALFADIKGSTELMEDLDPEDARALIDPALKLMIEAVRRYDGYVVQSTGDGIFALFGAPVAHEDHPQWALYAALRMQEELKRYLPIEGRIGVNTGEVVVRSIATGAGQTEYTPVGHTINLASRMQALAPTGSVVISEQTRKFVEGYFQVESLGPTRIKGISEAVNVYEVIGLGPLRTRLQRAVGRGLTKFVGRAPEMDAMKHAAEQAKSGHGQIVAVMADPGIGKSRLLLEFKATSQSEWMVLETCSISHGKANAYLPVVDLLRNYFRIASEDDDRTRREKVARQVIALDRSLEDTVPYVFSLLSIVEGDDPLAGMDAQVRRRRTLEAIKRIVQRESLNQPLMLIFEDLHWIDEETQAFLNQLVESIGNARVLLLVDYRPEYSHQWNSKTYYTQLRLGPLVKESAEEMLSALLGDGEDLNPLKRLIVERTEGTPFFMEEIVQSLFEEGVLVRNGALHLTHRLDALKVPATVQAILASRIDRLPADEKELLQTLATIGREFSLSPVREVIGKPAEELDRMMNDLQLAEFIYERPAVVDAEYIFKHALTQQVAYDSILTERRRTLHERIGAAIETLFADRLDDHLSDLAHHYRLSVNTQKALEYLHRAGKREVQRSASAAAINHFSTALDLLQTLPESRERLDLELALQLALGPPLYATKGMGAPEVERAFRRARELCEQIGEAAQLFPALVGLQGVYCFRAEWRTAQELAQVGLRLADQANDSQLLIEAHHMLMYPQGWQGKLRSCLIAGEQVEALYDLKLHRSHALMYGHDPGVCCIGFKALALWTMGYAEQALQAIYQVATLSRELGHPFSQYLYLLIATWVEGMRGDDAASSESARAMCSLCDEQGFEVFGGWASVFSGSILAKQGKVSEGIAQMEAGIAVLRVNQTKMGEPHRITLLADAYGKAGEIEKALRLLEEALVKTHKTGERLWEAETQRLKGELLLRREPSKLEEAQTCFRDAIGLARSQSAKSLELRATMSLARLLDKQGNRDEARTMLSDIYGWFTEGFDTADLKDAKVLLDELSA
jgi:class 3 adenylate cyclase/predicted ATPase